MTPAQAYWLVAKTVNGVFINDVKTYVHSNGQYPWLCEKSIPVINVSKLEMHDLSIED